MSQNLKFNPTQLQKFNPHILHNNVVTEKKKFTQFNLSGMIIKKRNNLLVFSRKNH